MTKRTFANLSAVVMLSLLSGCAVIDSIRHASSTKRTPGDANSELRKLAGVPGECNPLPDPKLAQHIVGYGSLMQDESRKRTSPSAGAAFPVVVQGFRRGWFAKGDGVGFETTYLGAVAAPKSQFNAVVYHVKLAELKATDERESFYCRRAVDAGAITVLATGEAPPLQGQVWIYVNKPGGVAVPNERYPIVQSYVDIFVSGCLEQEEKYHLSGFARQCLTTTTDWSRYWVSDRIYPRRPFIFEPKARQIDKLLSEQLPNYFQSIRIEAAGATGPLAKASRSTPN